MLPRDLYLPAPEGNTCQFCLTRYIDRGLTREELLFEHDGDDAPKNNHRRVSRDNGRTWSPLECHEGQTNRQLPGGGINLNVGHFCLDPAVDRTYQVVMPRIWPGMQLFTMDWKGGEHPFVDHVYVREKDAHSDVIKTLKYEEGADYDPQDPSEFQSLNFKQPLYAELAKQLALLDVRTEQRSRVD